MLREEGASKAEPEEAKDGNGVPTPNAVCCLFRGEERPEAEASDDEEGKVGEDVDVVCDCLLRGAERPDIEAEEGKEKNCEDDVVAAVCCCLLRGEDTAELEAEAIIGEDCTAVSVFRRRLFRERGMRS